MVMEFVRDSGIVYFLPREQRSILFVVEVLQNIKQFTTAFMHLFPEMEIQKRVLNVCLSFNNN